MAYSKKTKGWRKIDVDGETFRWRFNVSETGVLVLQGNKSSSQQLYVLMPEWFDPWLFVSHQHLLKNHPTTITSKFAAEAIHFGLANGWKPQATGSPLQLIYRNQTFIVAERTTSA